MKTNRYFYKLKLIEIIVDLGLKTLKWYSTIDN